MASWSLNIPLHVLILGNLTEESSIFHLTLLESGRCQMNSLVTRVRGLCRLTLKLFMTRNFATEFEQVFGVEFLVKEIYEITLLIADCQYVFASLNLTLFRTSQITLIVLMTTTLSWAIQGLFGAIQMSSKKEMLWLRSGARGYRSLGHAILNLVKSTHMCHLFDDFQTKTMLANQYRYLTSHINLALLYFLTIINGCPLLLLYLTLSLGNWLQCGIIGEEISDHSCIYLWHFIRHLGEQIYVPPQHVAINPPP